jgi:histidyl-tRNA synthetase
MNNVTQIRRYQIAKVYRRDQPAIARGRFREFHQCDFDIAGVYDPMVPDAEILRVVAEVFRALELDITIKINHRRILDGLFAVAGVPQDKTRTISAAVDKLDKISWSDVKKEMVEEKALPEEVADYIGEYVKKSGQLRHMLATLKQDRALLTNAEVQAGLADVELLVTYLEALGVADMVSFDLSLARGLDYYTSLIYEVLHTPSPQRIDVGEKPDSKSQTNDKSTQVGSIAAGGRYDNLVGMYGKKAIPCVGISFGVDRIFTILKARRVEGMRTRQIDAYIMAFGGKEFTGLLPQRLELASRLWDAGIRTEFAAKVKPKLPQQFKAAEGVPLAVILGQDELAAGKVRIKVLGLSDNDPEKGGVLIDKADVVVEVKKRLGNM